jgi:hypothetical protein
MGHASSAELPDIFQAGRGYSRNGGLARGSREKGQFNRIAAHQPWRRPLSLLHRRFETCVARAARHTWSFYRHADLEIDDTAGLETCAKWKKMRA